ncbi:3-hydroxyacyl-CoA dehydrogenase NAD-binding domain-containing protein [Planktotalea sp.]|uniref:3-hydroxyacyl-CoA dehydrogenase NAD-binding domain-containing protein n=1 Tax=Planktotalea sp. TaxID=2029877 RepID=UPI003F6C64F1
MSVTKRNEADVGYVEIDNPPVNAIGQSVRQGLLEAVRWAEELHLTRVILSGKGRAFAAGADAREFDQAPLEPHLPDVLNAIDESFVPWIAAIDGVALGGGAEVAMACRMRIMSPGSQIGLPEVTLGVIPGAGGTQRLPRLVGLAKALDMISLGKPLTAAQALATKLTHTVEDHPLEEAYMVNTEELGCIVPTWELPAPEHDASLITQARATIAKKSPQQIAPVQAIDVIEAGLSIPFHEALPIERAAFLELKTGDQARALRHIFFAERAAKMPDSIKAETVELDHIAVVGGGTMGAGIAYALLNAGLRATILETDADGVARAKTNVEALISAGLKRGLITEERAQGHRDRFVASTDYAQAGDAMLAIEAAFESMDVKKDVFAKLVDALPKDAILASNTSYLDINELAATLSDPSRVVGLHFFAPAHIMKLLEIVRGAQTSDTALATGFALGKKLRKIPVLAGVCDGFIGNRILARYREAADTVFMDGSTPWEVDEAMEMFGYAMGPYEAQDLSGLDIAHANRRRQDATRDPNRRYIPIADRMVELGKLGRKTGAGWYRYPGGNGKVDDPIVADLAIEESHLAKRDRTDYKAEEIKERLLLAMINEAADILDEGIAQNARDIDLVTVFGYGFPRWRGGLMHYADTLGAQAMVTRLRELSQEDPVAWKVSPLLERCADSGTKLADARPRS